MTDQQFEALAKLLRLRGGLSQEVVRLVFVEGLSIPKASKKTGVDPRLAHRAVKNARAGVALARVVSGLDEL
ncbi:hypothetical protein RZS08_05990 [Arthrospira platensis SPKY1]|nr:hypothetical protein [Arthrospira platensis SPKY1]